MDKCELNPRFSLEWLYKMCQKQQGDFVHAALKIWDLHSGMFVKLSIVVNMLGGLRSVLIVCFMLFLAYLTDQSVHNGGQTQKCTRTQGFRSLQNCKSLKRECSRLLQGKCSKNTMANKLGGQRLLNSTYLPRIKSNLSMTVLTFG